MNASTDGFKRKPLQLAGGFLSGKYRREQQGEQDSRRTKFDFPPVDKKRGYDCIDVMRPIAQAHGVSVAQIALAWLLHQPQVTSVIVGAKRPEQLVDNMAATDVVLNPTELQQLNDVSRLPAEYPGWMLERQGRLSEPADARTPRSDLNRFQSITTFTSRPNTACTVGTR